ncbi:MAG: class I SAM-dependent methyltransferase [Candidatus Eisenbacteria bacterium]
MRESTKEHWDNYWLAHKNADELYSNEERIVTQLVSCCQIEGAQILEVGAGSGRDSVSLVKAGGRVFVLDYVESSLSVVKEMARAEGVDVQLVCADATNMPFRDGTFDVLFHQGLMEHFRDPSPLIEENRRILRKDGAILVDVPQRYHVYTAAKHILILLGRWFAGWETEYTISSLERLMASHGFRHVCSYGDWMVPGFFYRSLRYVLRKFGVALLPKYPARVPIAGSVAGRFREWFRKKRAAYYTFAVIGVVGRKE